ncbi:MAG: hypothetical protein QME47_07590 [Candidatus Thermoplasmatota archaeon]|nr:hypothetical protein [Candidatus Thermoplasmatota archaeon]
MLEIILANLNLIWLAGSLAVGGIIGYFSRRRELLLTLIFAATAVALFACYTALTPAALLNLANHKIYAWYAVLYTTIPLGCGAPSGWAIARLRES